ncbi:hypothetical protein [Natronoglomus mannanivorans]|uniref:Uncharacterized protein n=1 Tax=Natronoglomus mannanivorans TaxID=2979990 RepID=A0AAP2Z3W8_9EURY|nr:hypothetical protein [Halobacteria archaeon AArc-xg1-1]
MTGNTVNTTGSAMPVGVLSGDWETSLTASRLFREVVVEQMTNRDIETLLEASESDMELFV